MPLSPGEIERLEEFGEAEAWADSYEGAPPEMARELGMAVRRAGSAVALVFGKIGDPFFNRVLGLGIDEPANEDAVDEMVEIYRQAGVSFMVQLSPTGLRAGLPSWLEARGFQRGANWAKFYQRVESPPDARTDLRIEQIGPELGATFAEVVFRAFGFPGSFRPVIPWVASLVGRPGWRHYLAYDGNTPVGTGALYVRGNLGWLGYGSTLPSHRRRGSQGAVFARRIRDAAGAGCEWLVTETGEDSPEDPNPSYHNMLRAGFRLAYLRPNYIYRRQE